MFKIIQDIKLENNFSLKECRCQNCSCGEVNYVPELTSKLQAFRDKTNELIYYITGENKNIGISPTSAYRCSGKQKKLIEDGLSNSGSQHPKGRAWDFNIYKYLPYLSWQELVRIAIGCGFTGIGVYFDKKTKEAKRFHLDVRTENDIKDKAAGYDYWEIYE